MNSKPCAIEVGEFIPAGITEAAPARTKRGKAENATAIALVICAHAAFLALLLLSNIRLGSRDAATHVESRLVMIEARTGDSAQTPAPALELLPSPIPELAPPAELDLSGSDADVPEAVKNNEFRPPVAMPTSESPVTYAQRAGMSLTRSARVILVVSVTEDGKAGEIEVATSSGDSTLDTAAVEYARGLSWIPAMVQGRTSTMRIRLPVVFAADT